jgi:hydroxymethylglutaryl-CoA lyase
LKGGAGVDWKNEIGPLPKRVEIVECGPRDGLQNERQLLPTMVKAELIARLVQTGAPVIEVTSFVKPNAVPQMADAKELYALVDQNNRTKGILPEQVSSFPPPNASSVTAPSSSSSSSSPSPASSSPSSSFSAAENDEQLRAQVRFSCLTPNIKGLETALALGVKEIAVFGAASTSFSKSNINCTKEESYERYRPVVELARERGVRVRGYISTVLGCPFEGPIKPAQVVEVVDRFWKMGCHEIALGDTIGTGTPGSTRNLLLALRDVVPVENLAVHFHDTWGQALPNILTSLLHGVSIVDSSVAGLGGCPYAPAATGNVATEDVALAE